MMQMNGRRRFLRTALCGTGALIAGSSLRAFGQSAPTAIATTPLRDGLIQITGAGGNVVLLPGASGAAMVDSGSPDYSAELVTQVTEHQEGGLVEVLFNTHWHLEHTGANEAFGGAGATITAHENTRLWMSTEYYVDWEDITYSPRPPIALPTHTFYSSDPQPITTDFAGEQIEYGHLPNAHTDGDIYVFFRNRNVLVAGGAVSVGAYPILDFATGGWIGGLMDSTQQLLELADEDTLIIPKEGPAQPRAHLQAQFEMVATVRERIENLMRQGKSAEEMIAAAVTAEFDANWGRNAERFIRNVYGGLWWQGRLDGSL